MTLLKFMMLGAGLLLVAACATRAPVVYAPPVDRTSGVVSGPLSQQGPFLPNAELFLCYRNGGSNLPAANNARRVYDFRPLVLVDEIIVATVPVNDACLTSGFGRRGGRPHKGIDIKTGGDLTIYSAAPGRIREVGQARGYGNYVLIDHGRGVFTRYAHLETFGPSIRENIEIGFGQPLGIMGDSGNATAVHLHYEVLTGRYRNPKRGFGLFAHDPLSFPEFVVGGAG